MGAGANFDTEARPVAAQPDRRVKQVSVVVPVYAETDALVMVVDGLVGALGRRLMEILVVKAAAAPTATSAVCAGLERRVAGVRVLEQARGPGLGWAVRQGIAAAGGTHILLIDGDGEMDVATVPEMVAALESGGADLAVASRWMPGGGAVGYSPVKYLLNRAYQFLFRLLYRTPLHDLTLGFKLGRAEVLQGLPWRGEFHEIATETTLRVVRAGCKVVEVPTVWQRRTSGASSNPFHRNFRYVAMALSILFQKRAGRR